MFNKIRKKLKRVVPGSSYALKLNNDDFKFFDNKESVRDYISRYQELNHIFNYQLYSITFKLL